MGGKGGCFNIEKGDFLLFSNRISLGGAGAGLGRGKGARGKIDKIVKNCLVYSNLNHKKCLLLSRHPTVLKLWLSSGIWSP